MLLLVINPNTDKASKYSIITCGIIFRIFMISLFKYNESRLFIWYSNMPPQTQNGETSLSLLIWKI